jgi:hypothetical protein
VWEYNDLNHRASARAAASKDRNLERLPGGREFVVEQQSEICNPAPFMQPLGSRDYGEGNIYEMRSYTYAPGDIAKVIEAWGKAIHSREEFSPLAAGMSTELGALNKWIHIWPYQDLNERARVRAESRKPGTGWPPQAGVRPVKQDNKILIPASFSPVK